MNATLPGPWACMARGLARPSFCTVLPTAKGVRGGACRYGLARAARAPLRPSWTREAGCTANDVPVRAGTVRAVSSRGPRCRLCHQASPIVLCSVAGWPGDGGSIAAYRQSGLEGERCSEKGDVPPLWVSEGGLEHGDRGDFPDVVRTATQMSYGCLNTRAVRSCRGWPRPLRRSAGHDRVAWPAGLTLGCCAAFPERRPRRWPGRPRVSGRGGSTRLPHGCRSRSRTDCAGQPVPAAGSE
jgi:hypothetical protein